jgi:DNA helicase-2/ATP-dependent DNA helicase PcrA
LYRGVKYGGIKMTFDELRKNNITAAIRDIEIKSRRAQYTYLAKVAASATSETAVLYRNSECMLPLVDLLERQNIDYRIINSDIGFLKDKAVTDICNIIKFAYNPTDIELFMQIYSKLSMFMSKSAAVEACRNSKEKQIPVIEAAIDFGMLNDGILKHAKAIQTHFREMLDDPADRAVYRIINYMGYGAYLERMEIDDRMVQILDAVGFNEPTPIRIVERLDELEGIIKGKKPNPESCFILSTIDSSKDVEYETVYLMDIKDGILPQTLDKTTAMYESERRRYQTAVTRAKNSLNIFSFKNDSVFTDELLGKTNKPVVKSHARKNLLLSKSAQSQSQAKKQVVESEYLNKLEEIKNSGHIKHKTYGEGKVLSYNGDTLEIVFPNKTAKCRLKFMMENGLIL